MVNYSALFVLEYTALVLVDALSAAQKCLVSER